MGPLDEHDAAAMQLDGHRHLRRIPTCPTGTWLDHTGSWREVDRQDPLFFPSPFQGSTESGLHLATELRRIDRRVAIQLRLDRLVQRSQTRPIYQPPLDHTAHILEVQVEAPLDL